MSRVVRRLFGRTNRTDRSECRTRVFIVGPAIFADGRGRHVRAFAGHYQGFVPVFRGFPAGQPADGRALRHRKTDNSSLDSLGHALILRLDLHVYSAIFVRQSSRTRFTRGALAYDRDEWRTNSEKIRFKGLVPSVFATLLRVYRAG